MIWVGALIIRPHTEMFLRKKDISEHKRQRQEREQWEKSCKQKPK